MDDLKGTARQLRDFYVLSSGTGLHVLAADQLDEAIAAIEALETELAEARAKIAQKDAALRMVKGAAYPVCDTIAARGYNWCEAYLDRALIEVNVALSDKGQASHD